MAILQQIIELLSRPPGSVIYHLITLFALQVILALAFSHWHRDANDEAARRMTFAAGGVLLARILLLFAGLLVEGDPLRARVWLPPLEQAFDMATVILLVWGLTPIAPDRPRLADGILLVSLVVVAVLFLFFFQEWQNRVGDGSVTIAYIGTVQAYVWGVLQMALLAGGLVRTLLDRDLWSSLRPVILAVVLVTHVANFFNYPEIIPTGTEVVYWLRLGYLVAFPLWAVLVYRDSMRGLLPAVEAERAQAAQLARHLRQATGIIRTHIPQIRLEQALELVTSVIPVQYAAIGLIDERNPQQVVFSRFRPAISRDPNYVRRFHLNDHAVFRMAYEQQRGIELEPRGVGARQAHELSQQFNVGTLGPVFVEPLVAGSSCFGFMLLAAAPGAVNWSDRDRQIIPHLAAFVAQAIDNVYRPEIESERKAAPAAVPVAQASERDVEKERLILELADTRRMLASTEERARQAETVAAIFQQTEPGQPTRAMTQITQTEVGPVIETACDKILPLVRQRNLTLDIAIAEDLPLVGIRESILRKLAVSLLENACRASLNDNFVLVRAEIAPVSRNGHVGRRAVAVRFTDSGVGIAAEDHERVFSSLSTSDEERPVAGLGGGAGSLGLVRKLAQTSGGDLDFESTAGRGTTFSLYLPAAEVQPWTLLKVKKPAAPDQPSAPAKE